MPKGGKYFEFWDLFENVGLYKYFTSNIKLSIGGTALTAIMLHEMSDSYDEEVHNSWEQEFLDYAKNLEVSQF